MAVKVPRDRKGEFNTQAIPRSKQYEDTLREDLCAMFLSRVSTRMLSLMSERLIGRSLSPTEVSVASKELSRSVERWRERDLSGETYKYIFLDGTLFSMRIDGPSIKSLFKARWENELPSAVKCLETYLATCLTYLSFPESEWP